ncbi:uncharacterized protein DUF4920 [Maribacter sp. MAR_2009_72]|nr:uncharacterized protein DUF4920 [Maribacter sp. MAR_2009_72]
MKGFNILLVLLFGIFSCQAQQQKQLRLSSDNQKVTFLGDSFELKDIKSSEEMMSLYKGMAVTDTLNITIKSKVNEVCKVKGCWMVIELPQGEQAMVRFKDYGFFMPNDIVDKSVVMNGLAFVEEMSVDDQRHYAKDAGKDEAEIAAIVAPKRTYSFEASGVVIPN